MKCQKCGRNNVSFHYSSNVNGAVTETHLCSVCATESGYDIESMFSFEDIFSGMLRTPNRIGGFVPMAIPVTPINRMFPFTMLPQADILQADMIKSKTLCNCEKHANREDRIEVDEKMRERRELNMQMRIAVENEEFEKAAELRDKIREISQ